MLVHMVCVVVKIRVMFLERCHSKYIVLHQLNINDVKESVEAK